MNRPRKKDRHLPAGVYHRHGAYYLVRRGKWTRLSDNLRDALTAYAATIDAPKGSMPELIETALDAVCGRVAKSTAKQYRVAATKLSRAFYEFKASLIGTPNMANRCLSLLRQVFDYAVEQQLVDENPAVGLKGFREAKRKRLITREEFDAIREQAAPRLQVIMDLCRLTGQRIGDVLAIRRANLTDSGIRFEQQKTGSKLTVAWSPELKDAVDRAKKLHQNIVALTLLHNRRGKAPDYRSVKLQWDSACTAAGVKDAHLHDLRALAATEAKRQGLNATALLGHSGAAQTVRYLRDKEEPVVEGPSFGQSIDSSKKP
jgi:integrase